MGKAFVVFIGIYFDNAKRDDQSKPFLCSRQKSIYKSSNFNKIRQHRSLATVQRSQEVVIKPPSYGWLKYGTGTSLKYLETKI